jgi:hypothetical protein
MLAIRWLEITASAVGISIVIELHDDAGAPGEGVHSTSCLPSARRRLDVRRLEPRDAPSRQSSPSASR